MVDAQNERLLKLAAWPVDSVHLSFGKADWISHAQTQKL